MDSVTAWLLGKALDPNLVGRLLEKSEFQRLRTVVRTSTGIRPGWRYRRWLKREQTWNNLVARDDDAYERLVDSLAKDEAQGILRRRPVDRTRATKLVNATIGQFLAVLDPALATAVSDFRNERRHQEVVDRLDASESFQERLEELPPPARHVLSGEQVHVGLAERIVDAVVRGDPRTVVAGFVAQPPDWLVEAPAVIQLGLAELAQAYGLRGEAAQLYERVADMGLDRARYYAKAAFEYVACGRSERRADLIEKARAADIDPYIEVVEAGLDDDCGKVLGAVTRNEAASDPFVASVYALALRQQGNPDASIAFLSEAIEELPQYPGIAIRLSQLLLDRSQMSGTTSRARDLHSALKLAVHARDLRRNWRGDSREAVLVACQAALVASDYGRVVRLGAPEPDGEAWPEEAAEPETQFIVAQAAIATGDNDLARQLAASASGFRQALITADLLATSRASQPEIDEQYKKAWQLAKAEQEKVDLWISASAAGVDPMPGEDELNRRADDLPLFTRASQHVARGHGAAAIELLRPNRQSETVRNLLVNAYLKQGDFDNAVAELGDMADRFDNAEHHLRAVEILVQAQRLTDAAELADYTLRKLSPEHNGRKLLHEVGVVAANNRCDWRDMEARVRAWINESGPYHHLRWLLAQSLYNQADSEAAWRITQADGELEPTNPLEAQLWIALHAEHEPSPAMLSGALALCERYPDDPDVRALGVNAFLLVATEEGDVSSEELSRWHALIEERARNPSPNDTFLPINVPDDAEGLYETLRPLLEPQARQAEEFRSKVRKGWPYGLLAVAAGRPYTTALTQRAAGFLPIASTDSRILDAEGDAAFAALDGPVIADLSVLVTAWYIHELWPQLLGLFTRVEVTSDSKRDAAVAAASMQPRPSGTLAWDIDAGRPVMQEMNADQLNRLEEHLTWINETISYLSVRSEPATPELPPDTTGQLGAWMTTFQAAKVGGVPLWADDVGLRTLARNEGIRSFGTDALLRALKSMGRLSDSRLTTLMETLRDQYCVDFSLDPKWLAASAERDSWRPGPALLTFTRPSTWGDLPRGLGLWQEIIDKAGNHDPAKVPPWVYAASTGIVGAVDVPTSVQLVAGILVAAAGAVKGDPTAFASCVSAAKTVSDAEAIPDPTEAAFRMAFEHLMQRTGPAEAATAVTKLGAHLAESDRQTLRHVIFGV